MQSIRRSLSELPVAPQNFRESPYFDPALFNYDEKLISHAERLKHCTEFPVKVCRCCLLCTEMLRIFCVRLHSQEYPEVMHLSCYHQYLRVTAPRRDILSTVSLATSLYNAPWASFCRFVCYEKQGTMPRRLYVWSPGREIVAICPLVNRIRFCPCVSRCLEGQRAFQEWTFDLSAFIYFFLFTVIFNCSIL